MECLPFFLHENIFFLSRYSHLLETHRCKLGKAKFFEWHFLEENKMKIQRKRPLGSRRNCDQANQFKSSGSQLGGIPDKSYYGLKIWQLRGNFPELP